MKIAVIIPAYKVSKHILDVINRVGPEVNKIFVIDDCCPEGSGLYVEKKIEDSRVKVLRLAENHGVGGAVMAGYTAALDEGMDILVKVDGDGQMDPAMIPELILPIVKGEADYTKGNRFYDLNSLKKMPKVRLLGNGILSFMSKFSTGYWNIFDPTNGYTAIHGRVASLLPLHKISKRYFFESDILFRLNLIRAVVVDVPMIAVYENEVSNLKIHRIVLEFIFKHFYNSFKRIIYSYYIRDMSAASVELPLGLVMTSFGVCYGSYKLIMGINAQIANSAGVVMAAALPVLLGVQFLLGFLHFDVWSVPRRAIHPGLEHQKLKSIGNR